MSVHDPCLGKAPNAWRGDEISRSPTPTLYQVSGGYGSQVARLALVEKGVAFKSRYVDLNSDTTQARDQGGLSRGQGHTQAGLPTVTQRLPWRAAATPRVRVSPPCGRASGWCTTHPGVSCPRLPAGRRWDAPWDWPP